MHHQLSKRESTLGRINRTIWSPCRGVVHQTAGLHLIEDLSRDARIVETLPCIFLCHSNLTNGFVYRSFINNPVLGLQCEDRGDACIRCNWMTTPGPYVSSIPTSMPPCCCLLGGGLVFTRVKGHTNCSEIWIVDQKPVVRTECIYGIDRRHTWARSRLAVVLRGAGEWRCGTKQGNQSKFRSPHDHAG